MNQTTGGLPQGSEPSLGQTTILRLLQLGDLDREVGPQAGYQFQDFPMVEAETEHFPLPLENIEATKDIFLVREEPIAAVEIQEIEPLREIPTENAAIAPAPIFFWS